MTDDAEHLLLELARGETDVLRVTRRLYEGRPFTDVRVFFRGEDGHLHPTKKGTSIRDGEIDQVIGALERVRAKVRATMPTQQAQQSPPHREPQQSLPAQRDFDEEHEEKDLF